MYIKLLKNKNLNKNFVFLLLMLLFLSLLSHAELKQAEKTMRIIVLIDITEFHCGVCILRFGTITDMINKRKLSKNTMGILLYGKNKLIDRLRKEIKGIKLGNNIKFPVAIDNLNIFGKTKERYDIIVIKDNMMKGYKYSEFLKEVSKWKEY